MYTRHQQYLQTLAQNLEKICNYGGTRDIRAWKIWNTHDSQWETSPVMHKAVSRCNGRWPYACLETFLHSNPCDSVEPGIYVFFLQNL